MTKILFKRRRDGKGVEKGGNMTEIQCTQKPYFLSTRCKLGC